MSCIKTRFIFLTLILCGCTSSSAPSYYEPGCGKADAYCIAEIVAYVIDQPESSKKCSAMVGEQKKSCDTQVKALKKHINDASKK
ncbi:hypothetical protein [Colwellia psychrerythraea]|uniref:Lipoprotein n=1 Tax=Colwellia psychrerythraea TaxID=28229 RepID=A0A099KTJ1_COLPS|nr:hypothetical protein [Colwellia psychrerythraea]KGJ93510.1 hypothetical protein ND2E_2239 [Colwellia psychrerythraea]